MTLPKKSIVEPITITRNNRDRTSHILNEVLFRPTMITHYCIPAHILDGQIINKEFVGYTLDEWLLSEAKKFAAGGPFYENGKPFNKYRIFDVINEGDVINGYGTQTFIRQYRNDYTEEISEYETRLNPEGYPIGKRFTKKLRYYCEDLLIDTYTGYWKNGKKHGHGVYKVGIKNYISQSSWNDPTYNWKKNLTELTEPEEVYTGEFENGLVQGNGILTNKYGAKFVGKFISSGKDLQRAVGEGEDILTLGEEKFSGIFNGGLNNRTGGGIGPITEGELIIKFDNGDSMKIIGMWVDTTMHGKMITHFLTGHNAGAQIEEVYNRGISVSTGNKLFKKILDYFD